jgi:ferritin-like metal-binding protein YciE
MANKPKTKSQSGTLAAKKTAYGSVRANSLSGNSSSESSESVTMNQVKSGGQQTLHTMFEKLLQDTYSAETQLVEALPKMAQAAENEELQDAFNYHLNQTQKHVERLEKVFNRLGIDKGAETCKAMEGLIEEGNKIIEEYEENAVRDSALIIGAQKIEHYEIASYGSLCELADVLGYEKVYDILGRTLDEEEETDKTLSEIAEEINDEAVELGHDDDMAEEEE